MVTVGTNERGKQVAEQLAKDLGFFAGYDFGGDDKFELIEQFVIWWINLAIMQGWDRMLYLKY